MNPSLEHDLRLLRALLCYRAMGMRRSWKRARIVARIRWLTLRLRGR